VRSKTLFRWKTLSLVALLLSTTFVGAAETKPLPDFEVKTVEGRAVKSSAFTSEERWLLVYIEPGCQPCETILRVFQRETEAGDQSKRVVVVVGGRQPDEVRAMAAGFPWLPPGCWYADPARHASLALKAKGAPVVYGIRKGNIEWTLAGALSGQKNLKSILLTWREG
jgi:hypothetical protein